MSPRDGRNRYLTLEAVLNMYYSILKVFGNSEDTKLFKASFSCNRIDRDILDTIASSIGSHVSVYHCLEK